MEKNIITTIRKIIIIYAIIFVGIYIGIFVTSFFLFLKYYTAPEQVDLANTILNGFTVSIIPGRIVILLSLIIIAVGFCGCEYLLPNERIKK